MIIVIFVYEDNKCQELCEGELLAEEIQDRRNVAWLAIKMRVEIKIGDDITTSLEVFLTGRLQFFDRDRGTLCLTGL